MGGTSRGAWTGQLGFVLAAAGSAVGLGNIWMFPYRTGMNGGGAFVLVYLGAVLLVGIPLLVAEVMLGRTTGRNPVGAFRALRPASAWPVVGWLGVVAGFVILSFYGVVAGWAMDYVWRSAGGLLAWGLFVPLLIFVLGPELGPQFTGPEGTDWPGLAGHLWRYTVRPIAVGGMLVGDRTVG